MYMFTATTAATGKATGVFASEPEDVGGYATKGYTFFTIASKANTLDDAARGALRVARGAVAGAATPEVV
ncbi:MAG: hypothetical protein U9O18_02680 [Chloroflexota bacterium]|nr:hypothetical protein [Chloroflexota bacterium]